MVTDCLTFEDGYPCVLYNWFGGSSTVDYECGYNFDTGKFSVTETKSRKVLAEKTYDFTLNEWHHWVFQYFKDNCEIRFYFDPPMEYGHVARDAVPVFNMRYRYFDSPGQNSCELIFRRLNCQIMMDNVKFYNFVDFTRMNVFVYGDANRDGVADLKDVLLLRRVAAGLEVHPERYWFGPADVVYDGTIDLKDILKLRRYLAGLEEEPLYWPPVITGYEH